LGLESSCDETAAAVVCGRGASERAPHLLSSVVASQIALHRPFGGIVPELASRSHIRFMTEVTAEALRKARLDLDDIDAVAATAGPGLPGSLLVGLTFGKALAWMARKPFVAVNHVEAHVYSAFLAAPGLKPPLLALVASGGHTDLIRMPRPGAFSVIGRTRDDAAGEAYDKVAKLMGLGYPGGPALERMARKTTRGVPLPVARMKDGSLDFSFSGLKTAVANAAPRARSAAGLALGFQEAVIGALVGRAREALRERKVRALVLAGGVAANGAIRKAFTALAAEAGVRLVLPPVHLCTDNAAMIACAGWYKARKRAFSPLTAGAWANWRAGEPLPRPGQQARPEAR
jgi:N6-L-threonylcarbamoyladenine synthase